MSAISSAVVVSGSGSEVDALRRDHAAGGETDDAEDADRRQPTQRAVAGGRSTRSSLDPAWVRRHCDRAEAVSQRATGAPVAR